MKQIKLEKPIKDKENLEILRPYVGKDVKVEKKNGLEIEGKLFTLDIGPTLFIKQFKGEKAVIHITDIEKIHEL